MLHRHKEGKKISTLSIYTCTKAHVKTTCGHDSDKFLMSQADESVNAGFIPGLSIHRVHIWQTAADCLEKQQKTHICYISIKRNSSFIVNKSKEVFSPNKEEQRTHPWSSSSCWRLRFSYFQDQHSAPLLFLPQDDLQHKRMTDYCSVSSFI